MKNIELLPISEESKKRIETGVRMYQQYAHIIIEIISFRNNRLIVRVEQKDLVGKKSPLTKPELVERVREMLKGVIPEDWKVTVSAVDFDRRDIDAVNPEWIRRRMSRLKLRNKHISNYTGIDKCTVSSVIAGEKELTKWHKAAFYYFFKYNEAMAMSFEKKDKEKKLSTVQF
ncbi:hypothetical protein FACS189434_02590 [Bacteroidia bacterium]|nr:hypothetical protein FACS189434_02590 [Bacteroidia bacterium]